MNTWTIVRVSATTKDGSIGVKGETGYVPSTCYIRPDVEELVLDAEKGILHDVRKSPTHVGRDRDVLFADEGLLDCYTSEATRTVGQNITLAGSGIVSEWCVGDVLSFCSSSKAEGPQVVVTSCRKPCPKNSVVHGAGTQQRMMSTGSGGVFARIMRGGTVRPGDCVKLLSRPQPRWPCTLVHRLLLGDLLTSDPAVLQELATLEFLEKPRYQDRAIQLLKQAQNQHQLCYQRACLVAIGVAVVISLSRLIYRQHRS